MSLSTRVSPNATRHRFLLEYDYERSGDLAPLAAIPRGKRVVLKLVVDVARVIRGQVRQ